jgi:putative transposase
MSSEELPSRHSRGGSHVPPDWVATDSTFFITINCKPSGPDQLTAGDTPHRILESITFLRDRRNWFPEIVLLMPDHLHALISFPWDAKLGMNRVIADWKRYVATQFGVSWQRDYFDHRIRSEQDHQSTWYYIRENPVRAGLVETYDQWPHVWLPAQIGWPKAQGPISGQSLE